MALAPQEPSKPHPVGTSSLDSERSHVAGGGGPLLELPIPIGRCNDSQFTHPTAKLIEGDGDMNVFVGVDPNDDLARLLRRDAWHRLLISFPTRRPMSRWSGGRTGL
jgi:hypothetical protein